MIMTIVLLTNRDECHVLNMTGFVDLAKTDQTEILTEHLRCLRTGTLLDI